MSKSSDQRVCVGDEANCCCAPPDTLREDLIHWPRRRPPRKEIRHAVHDPRLRDRPTPSRLATIPSGPAPTGTRGAATSVRLPRAASSSPPAVCSLRRPRPRCACATGSVRCRTARSLTARSTSGATSSWTSPTSTPRWSGPSSARLRRMPRSRYDHCCRRLPRCDGVTESHRIGGGSRGRRGDRARLLRPARRRSRVRHPRHRRCRGRLFRRARRCTAELASSRCSDPSRQLAPDRGAAEHHRNGPKT